MWSIGQTATIYINKTAKDSWKARWLTHLLYMRKEAVDGQRELLLKEKDISTVGLIAYYGAYVTFLLKQFILQLLFLPAT